MAAEPKEDRLGILDAIRGLTCLWVALYHFTANFQETAGFPAKGWLTFLGSGGYLGVYPFFVISGFVLPFSFDRSKYQISGYGRFIGKRILRLHPLYLISLAICIMFMRLPGGWSDIWPHFFYLNAVLGRPWFMELYWTLGLEIQYSLLIALVFPLIANSRRWVRWLTLFVFLLPGAIWKNPVWVTHYTGFYALGILVFWKLTSREGWLETALGMILCSWIIRQGHGLPHMALGLVTAALIAFGKCSLPALGWLGRVSYAMYLFHLFLGQPILELAIKAPRTEIGDAAWILAALAASVAGAGLIHHWVEKPIAKWTGKWLRANPARHVPSAS